MANDRDSRAAALADYLMTGRVLGADLHRTRERPLPHRTSPPLEVPMTMPAPAVQARFYVCGVNKRTYGGDVMTEITLQAVSRGRENATWAAATPAGTITLTIGNPVAAKWFEDRLGQDTAIYFADAPVPS